MRVVFVSIWLGASLALGCGEDGAASDGGPPRVPVAAQRDAAGGSGGSASTQSPDGGATEDLDCTEPTGTYRASYTEQSGDCGPISNPFDVPFGSGREGTQIGQFPSARVETEFTVSISDCRLRVTQTVITTDLRVVIEADGLSIGADGVITGSANVTRYEPGGELVCSGVYTLELRPSGIIGVPLRDAGSPGDLPDDVQAAVAYDCQHTVQCRAQQGDTLPPDPVASCIALTSELLAMNSFRWPTFLELHRRCMAFVVCDYLNCVTSQ